MLRYIRLTFALFRYSLSRELMFKINFLTWIVVELAWFGIQLALFEVIYSHVESIAGWTKFQMILLLGTSHVVQQTFQFFFMVNCIELPENVRTGKLDFALLQPANTQFLVSIRKFDLGALVNGSIGLGICAYSGWKLGLHPTLGQLCLFGVLVLNGAFIHYAMMLFIVTASFWIVRAQGLVYGYYNLFQLTRIPQEAFRGAARALFTFGIPLLVVANYPASVLARGLSAWNAGWTLLLSVFLVSCASAWFRFALRCYRSASS